jgi:acyl-coenzyme A thioesterase PaaI-like protein
MESLNIYKASKVGQDWHHANCYGCGPENPVGLHMEFPFDEESGEVVFKIKIPSQFEGAPGFVHGGVLASLLDEAQGVLCFHIGHFVMTDQLHIKYRKACPLNTELEFKAIITAVRKRRLYTKATVTNPETGDIHVYSHARWYDMQEKVITRMFQNTSLSLDNLLNTMELNKKRGKEIRRRIKNK